MIDYSISIKKAIKRVNAGKGDEAWNELRKLQQDFAKHLLTFAVDTIGGKKVVEIPRTIIRLLSVRDFPSGTIIRTGKYRVDCNGLKTRVEDINTWRTLHSGQTPLYLKEFGTV